MTISEVIWTIAFCTFLCGAAWSFRSNGARGAVTVMCAALCLDFSVTLLPRFGFTMFSYGAWRANTSTFVSGGLGLLVVALLATAVILRLRGAMRAYHLVIAATQIAWFLSFIGFLYGLYIVRDPV